MLLRFWAPKSRRGRLRCMRISARPLRSWRPQAAVAGRQPSGGRQSPIRVSLSSCWELRQLWPKCGKVVAKSRPTGAHSGCMGLATRPWPKLRGWPSAGGSAVAWPRVAPRAALNAAQKRQAKLADSTLSALPANNYEPAEEMQTMTSARFTATAPPTGWQRQASQPARKARRHERLVGERKGRRLASKLIGRPRRPSRPIRRQAAQEAKCEM